MRTHRSTIEDIAAKLLESYENDELAAISYTGRHRHPDRETIIKITEGFFPILYAGYWGQRPNSERFVFFLPQQISWIREQLGEQIVRALKAANTSGTVTDQYHGWGMEMADLLIEELPRLRRLLAADIKAAYQADPAATGYGEIVMNYPGVYAITVYRLAHVLHRLCVPLIPRMMTEYAHSKTAIDIHPGARIGRGFFIDHGTGVVVGETCDIGRNVTLYQGVTLGAITFDRDDDGELIRGTKRHPTLEDHVTVYANATILGGTTIIGRNSTVGANVWLMHSLPPESLAKLEKRKLRIETKRRLPESKTAREEREMQQALARLADDGCPHHGDI